MIYGSIRVHRPIWVAKGEKNNVEKVKTIISDSDLFRGLCLGDSQHGYGWVDFDLLLILEQISPFRAIGRNKLVILVSRKCLRDHFPLFVS